jgi:hypothetical protein
MQPEQIHPIHEETAFVIPFPVQLPPPLTTTHDFLRQRPNRNPMFQLIRQAGQRRISENLETYWKIFDTIEKLQDASDGVLASMMVDGLEQHINTVKNQWSATVRARRPLSHPRLQPPVLGSRSRLSNTSRADR